MEQHFNGGATTLDMHKYREQELLKQSESERTAQTLRQKVTRRLRRPVRKNEHNPAN